MDLSTFHILTGHFPMQGIYLSPQIANDVAPESHIPFCRRIGLPHLNRTRAKTAYGARLWHDSGASTALRNRATVVDIMPLCGPEVNFHLGPVYTDKL